MNQDIQQRIIESCVNDPEGVHLSSYNAGANFVLNTILPEEMGSLQNG